MIPGSETARVSCVINDGAYTIGMAWGGEGKPTTEDRSGNAYGFIYKMFDQATVIDTSLVVATSTMAIAPSSVTKCSEMESKVILPALVIDNGSRSEPLPLSAFGIYEYPNRLDGRVEIRLQKAGEGYEHDLAFRFDVGETEPNHLRVELSDGSDINYVVQRDGTAYIIWIENGIPYDHPLVIEAS